MTAFVDPSIFPAAVGPYSSYLVETFVTLVVVCGLAFVVLYGARRLGIGQPSGAARLVGRLPLDARRAVYLVKIGAKVLVVGASEAGLTKLGEMDEAELPKEEAAKTTDFGAVLARAMGKKKKDGSDDE